MDERVKELARIIVEDAWHLKAKQYVQIVGGFEAKELMLAVFELAVKKGAYPTVKAILDGTSYIYYKNAKTHQLEWFPKIAFEEMKQTDCVCYVQSANNRKELANINAEKLQFKSKVMKPIEDWRVNKTKWTIVAYPSNGFAQDSEMSLQEYGDFVFGATNFDWSKLKPKMEKLAGLECKTDRVRIVGKETDLEFSVKGRKAITDLDFKNIPAGEVFNSVVEDSVEGHIYYDMPAMYLGKEVDNVRLEFSKGKVVKATAEKNQEFLNTVLDTDKGARFLGEFGIGLNYGIRKFAKNILFDEKIGGTIHLACGQSYKECKGLNKSAVHWDMIKDLRKGGKILFDGKVVERNGKLAV